MAVKAIDSKGLSSVGNVGVQAGAVIVVVCFFLPWVGFHPVSAMTISSDPDKADLALLYLGIRPTSPLRRVGALYLIPMIALSTLMIELVIPPGHVGRRSARLGVHVAAAALTSFFVAFGYLFGTQLTYGFWGSLTGSLFISVGGLFNEIRNE
ncbi:MAG: hypothetical protein AMK75_05160 [Planctomycetes bacterium SM23_65]|nr:MAG: hypothetical protein AMK75_05160 [Planctomycetes bacterium SM23_65]